MGGTPGSKELVPAKAPAARKAVADRLAEKRNTGAALLALVQFKKISQAEAWRRLHPLATNVTDTQARFRARRLLQWYLTYYPPNFQQALELNHLGRQRILQEMQADAEGHQVRYNERFQAGGSRTGRTRTHAVDEHLLLLNAITPQGDYLDGAVKDARTKGREIDTGPEFKSPEEWYAMAMKVQAEAEKTYKRNRRATTNQAESGSLQAPGLFYDLRAITTSRATPGCSSSVSRRRSTFPGHHGRRRVEPPLKLRDPALGSTPP